METVCVNMNNTKNISSMATTLDTSLAKRRDWSEQVFGFALSLWHSYRNGRPTPSFGSNSQMSSSVVSTTTTASSSCLANRRTGVICSCLCHCAMKSSSNSDENVFLKNIDQDNPADGYSSRHLTSKLRRPKKRHNSADHVKCIKILHRNKSELPPLSKQKFGSAGHKKSICDDCGCGEVSCLEETSPGNISSSDEEIAEVYDKSSGKLICLQSPVSPVLSGGSSIKQSCSDPALSAAECSPTTQNCINEHASKWPYSTTDRRKVLARGSVSNSSFSAKPRGGSTAALHLKNKKNMSFRISTRQLTKRFSTNRIPERVCPSPGNVKLSAINNLSNKPIELLREQLDGNLPKQYSSTNINLMNSNNELIDKSQQKHMYKTLSSSLRRRRKSFLRGSVSRIKVQPTCLPVCNNNDISRVPTNTNSTTSFSAWNDEFDDLHHASCPCRQSIGNKVTFIYFFPPPFFI